MQNKLILSLWLIGGLLYAGSTVFLANTLLGGPAADKERSLRIAAAGDAQCAKENVAAAEADDMKTAAVDPKPAPEPEKPAPAKPEAAQAPNPGSAEQDAAAPDPQQDAEATQEWHRPGDAADPSQDMAGLPDGGEADAPWGHDQAGMQPDAPAEQDEWAHVIAGTANMRSEPSLQSQLIYALPSGWQVRVVSRRPGWVQVQDANSGAAGWVEATAIAPGPGAPGGGSAYGRYPQGPYGSPYPRYADEGYPAGPPPWERRRERRGDFGSFLRGVFGGF